MPRSRHKNKAINRLYDPCYFCLSFFLSFLLSNSCTLFKLQTKNVCVFPYFLVKNSTPLCGKFHGFFRTGSKSREKIEKFQRERLFKRLLCNSVRAFSKIRIVSRETGYLAFISTTSSLLETKSSDHFKDLHKPRLLKNIS